MLKRKIDKYLENWKTNRNTALLVAGARQVGKSFSINHFIRKEFEHFITINFASRTDLIDSFAQLKNPEQILIILSATEGANLIPGKTVIFFDEIQLLYIRREELRKKNLLDPNSLDLVTCMKPLTEEGKYRYILSGSLLGVTIKDIVLNPVGYLDEYRMFPLDFEEYLWAKNVGGESIKYLNKCFIEETEVDRTVNQLFLNYFQEYVLIGGMPEAVTTFIDTKNLFNLQITQEQLVAGNVIDITKYIDDDGKKLRVREIYNAIPSELNSKNKRFVSSHVIDKNYLKRNDIVDEYVWLAAAGIALPVYNVTNATIPLILASERKTLKLFYSDIGLLDSMLFSTGTREKLLKNEKEINYGAPYENVVAQELYAHGYLNKLFYYNSKKNGEVDFLVEKDGDVLPIEIKSGKPNEMN